MLHLLSGGQQLGRRAGWCRRGACRGKSLPEGMHGRLAQPQVAAVAPVDDVFGGPLDRDIDPRRVNDRQRPAGQRELRPMASGSPARGPSEVPPAGRDRDDNATIIARRICSVPRIGPAAPLGSDHLGHHHPFQVAVWRPGRARAIAAVGRPP